MAQLELRVQPGSRRTGFVGWYGDMPKLAVAAPPVDGAANEAAIETLAELLELRRSQVRLIAGVSSRRKRFEITGFTADELRARVVALNPRR